MDNHSPSKACSSTLNVPLKAVCSRLSPTVSAGNTSTELSAGKRCIIRRTTPSLMTASVDSGRCGPCCSTAATGSSAIVRAASTLAKSVVRMSCQ